MSLITSASPWINEESTNKKRPSTMRKTIKLKPNDAEDYVSQSENYQNLSNLSSTTDENNIEDTQKSMQERNTRVNDLLNKITSMDNESDDKLGNFQPLPNPNINVKKDMTDNTETKIYSPSFPSYSSAANLQKNGPYVASETSSGPYSNYNLTYNQPIQLPYYSKMAASSNDNNNLMEKINYMIHLLEEQQLEKTNNITEEFILYTFLGVFIIFVVDSFSRSGKYIR